MFMHDSTKKVKLWHDWRAGNRGRTRVIADLQATHIRRSTLSRNMLRARMLSLLRQQRHGKGKEKANMLTSTPVDPAAGAGVVSLVVSLMLG